VFSRSTSQESRLTLQMTLPTKPHPDRKRNDSCRDDEEFQVQSIKEMLGRLGYHVSGKTRSLEALELFRTEPEQFDLVITDEVMPVMTGSKLAQEL